MLYDQKSLQVENVKKFVINSVIQAALRGEDNVVIEMGAFLSFFPVSELISKRYSHAIDYDAGKIRISWAE